MIGTESGISGSTGAASVQAPSTPTPASTSSETTGASGGTGETQAGGKSAGQQAGETLASKFAGLGKSGGKTVADPAATPAEGAPAVSAYTPNHKFKVLDKDMEFEDWAKSAIKDADTEKKVRELHEKAFGLDSVKQDRQTLKTELSEAKERIASTDRALETVGSYAREKDWDSFFEALKIPKNDILQYALTLVQREQMPPEQRQQWEASRQAQKDAQYYQSQNQGLVQERQAFQVEQREFQLQTALSKPEVVPIVEAYNAGMANPGAFREFVIRIGQSYAATGKDLPADQVVMEAVRHLRAANPQLGMPTPTTPVASNVVQPSGKQTLPNIAGRGTSPVKATVKSLADLKQRARELNG